MRIYQVDAFHNELFKGNPAAVCPLERWISDELMQQIAEENNLSETVFFVPNGIQFDIRWFTPASEIDLCGHATLASAYVILNCLDYDFNNVIFQTMSGELKVFKKGSYLEMDLPSRPPEVSTLPKIIQPETN